MGWQAIIWASSCGSLEGSRGEATILWIRQKLCCSMLVSLLAHFFFSPEWFICTNYYHVVSYNAFAIKLY